MSGIITAVVLFLGWRNSTDLGYWVAKSTITLNRWEYRIQSRVYGKGTNLEDNDMESKASVVGRMSTCSNMTAMDWGILVVKSTKRGEVLKD